MAPAKKSNPKVSDVPPEKDLARSLPARSEMHLKRKVFHVFNGLLYVVGYSYMDLPLFFVFYLPFVIFCFFLELGRLNVPFIARWTAVVLGPFMRAHEVKKVSGASLLMIILFVELCLYCSLTFQPIQASATTYLVCC